jgi:DNA-binding winged helix-turn-helix (wHTH) protein/TolB-like protein
MSNGDNNLLLFGSCRLDPARRVLWSGDDPVALPPKAVDLLTVLVEKGGDVVTKEEIWERVWQDAFIEETNLTHNIYLLRKALKEIGEGDLIKTVSRRGYRFVGEVRRSQSGAIVVERHAITRTLVEDITDAPRVLDIQLAAPHQLAAASSRRGIFWATIVAVILIAFVVVFARFRGAAARPAGTEISSIAILPFDAGGDDADLEYVADGMTESLIDSLSQMPNLSVKARDSAFRYRGSDPAAGAVGSQLGVQVIVTGRIVRRSNELTLFASLIDTASNNVLWGKQYTGDLTKLTTIENELARDVVSNLHTQVSNEDRQSLAKRSTGNPDAYLEYLRGRLYWNKRTPADLQRSIQYFQKAIDLDPNFAFAYAGLANAYPYLASYGNESPRDVMPKARDAALKAISLDPDLAEAHTALGLIEHGFDHDYAGAEKEYKLAIELGPNYAHAHQLYGELLDCIGRHEEAGAEYKLALDVDPLSLIVNRMYGEHLYYSHRYDEAVEQLKKTIELDPTFYTAHASLAYVYEAQGNYAGAAEEFAETHASIGETENAAMMRNSFAERGWPGFLQYMTGDHRPKTLPMFNVAVFFAELGDKDHAFAVLNDMNEDRDYLINWINVDPRLDVLKSDPRFGELIKKMGLPT